MSLIVENQPLAQQIKAESYLRESVAPKASEIDSDPAVLKDVLREMSDRNPLNNNLRQWQIVAGIKL